MLLQSSSGNNSFFEIKEGTCPLCFRNLYFVSPGMPNMKTKSIRFSASAVEHHFRGYLRSELVDVFLIFETSILIDQRQYQSREIKSILYWVISPAFRGEKVFFEIN